MGTATAQERFGSWGGEEFSKGKQNKIYRQVLFSAPAAHGKVPASGPDRLPSRKKPRKALGKKIAVINQLPVLHC